MTAVVRSASVADSAAHDSSWPSPRYGWYVTAVMAVAYVLSYMDRAVMGLLVEPIKASLGLSDTQMSLLLGFAFSVFYALGGLPLGYLADRVTRKHIIVLGIAFWSLMTASCAGARSFPVLFLCRIGVGVGEAGLNPAALSSISDWFPPGRRAFPLATFLVGGSMGAGLAMVAGSALLELGERMAGVALPLVGTLQPWQWVFVFVSLPGLPLSIWVATLREPIRREVLPSASATASAAYAAYLKRHWRCLIGLCVGTSLLMLVAMAYLMWAPTLLVRVHGVSVQQAGVLFGAPCIVAGLLGTFLGTTLAQRVSRSGREDGPVLAIMAIGVVAMIPLLVGPLLDGPLLVVLVVVPAIGLVVGTPTIALVGAQRVFPNGLRARTVAIFNLLANLLAYGLGPMVVGLMNDRLYGANGIHYSIVTTAAVGVPLALLVLARTRRHFRAASLESRCFLVVC